MAFYPGAHAAFGLPATFAVPHQHAGFHFPLGAVSAYPSAFPAAHAHGLPQSAFPSYGVPAFPSAFGSPTIGIPAAPAAPVAQAAPAAAPKADAEGHLEAGAKPGTDVCWTLIYWPVRGLGAPIRMLLAYGGAQYEEQTVTAPEWFGPDGLKAKLSGENPFVNLPLFEDGALVLAQSNSILRHLARKMNLIGCSEITAAKCDMLLDQLTDLRTQFTRLMYGTPAAQYAEEAAKHFGETAKTHFAKFTEWFALNGTQFLVEDHPTVADFVLWELLDVHLLASPNVLDDFPRLAEFHAALRGVPQLAKYFESDAAAFPPNGPSANWNP